MTRIESKDQKKTRKVSQARFHQAIPVIGAVKTSLDAKKDKAEMELYPMGVYINLGTKEMIVPYANIHSLDLLPE